MELAASAVGTSYRCIAKAVRITIAACIRRVAKYSENDADAKKGFADVHD